MVVRINDVKFGLVHVVSFMAIALMRIQVDDKEALVVEPLFHVLSDECDVRVYAKTAAV